jgi:hypothetical protein
MTGPTPAPNSSERLSLPSGPPFEAVGLRDYARGRAEAFGTPTPSSDWLAVSRW